MKEKILFINVKIECILALLVLLMLSSSCVNHKRATLIREDDKAAKLFDIENPRETTYKVQTGDQLYIKVYSLDPKTSKFFQSDLPNLMNPTYLYLNSYTVDKNGFIRFSIIDKLHVENLTLKEAQESIHQTLKEYFNEITVDVKLVGFNVSIMGEVNSPGTYNFKREYANILQALSRAGGVNEYADINRVKLIRQTPSGSTVKIIDISQLELLSRDCYHLMPNDILYVEHRPIKTFDAKNLPYGILFSIVSTALVIYNIFLN